MKTIKFFIVFGLCLFWKLKSQTNLNVGLTACYALNGNALEPINNLNGTLGAITTTLDRYSNANSAIKFLGSASSFIELPDDPLLKPTNELSFSAFIKFDLLNAPQYIVFTKNNANSNFESYALVTAIVNGNYRFRVHKGDGTGSTTLITGTTNIQIGTWYHVAITMDNSNLNIYVNGVLENTITTSHSFNYQNNKKVYLGGTNESSFNGPFNGSLDNVRFYNRFLNPAEITSLLILDPVCLPATQLPLASFSVSTFSACVNQSLSCTELSSNNPTSRVWIAPGASFTNANTNNPILSYSTAGVYTISLSSSNAAGTSTNVATQTLMVNNIPTLSINGSTILCPNAPQTYVANGAVTYTWPANQTGFMPFSTQYSSVITLISASFGNYPLKVFGTNSLNCTSSHSIMLRRVSDCFVFGINENNLEITSIIAPNPFYNFLTLNNYTGLEMNFCIHDVFGKLHLKGIFENQIKLDLATLPEGIYFLELIQNENKFVKKIIKQ